MTLFALLKLVHVASAFWFVAGLLGRWYALSAASRAPEVKLTRAFAGRLGSSPRSLSLPGFMVLVPIVFLPRGKVFGAALEEAAKRDQVTPGLRAAFADSVAVRSRWAELIGVSAILVLMVLKPF